MKNILLISSGLSPQVITETLYYYHCVRNPSLLFSEIHVITEKNGADRIKKNLLGKKGHLNRFISDYSIDPDTISLSENNIYIMQKESGELIVDLETISDIKSTLNQVFSIIRKLTEDDNTRLFTSIAGGRKSMSVIIGQAMQFFSRPQDKLIHVLVDDILFNSEEFYYPAPKKHEIRVKDKKIDISKVLVNVNELPFVRLRPIIGNILSQTEKSSVKDLVDTAQTQIDDLFEPINIKLNHQKSQITVNDYVIHLPAKNLSIYNAFLLSIDSSYGQEKNGFLDIDEVLSKPFLKFYLSAYEEVKGSKSALFLKEKQRVDKFTEFDAFYTKQWFLESKSKINKELKKVLPPYIYESASIVTDGKYGYRMYGISISKENFN